MDQSSVEWNRKLRWSEDISSQSSTIEGFAASLQTIPIHTRRAVREFKSWQDEIQSLAEAGIATPFEQ